MSITQGQSRASSSALPSRTSGIPTPGRPRSASSIHSNSALSSGVEDEYVSRAFADALKANDPANHRASHEPSSPSSPPRWPSHSGRRSVVGRPSSVASSSSIASVPASRYTKPPPRPASRTSDVFTRSSSRASKTFDIGDRVRVESLGFEGVLRFIGEIEGKAGTFAGVELSGGFTGKGKNDGSVNGKRYFTCPPGCGIFILSSKLSVPTVGHSRPASVASAQNERATPSAPPSIPHGRKTPSHSFSGGRITPASLITPGPSTNRNTVAPRTRTTTITKNSVTSHKSKAPESIITPGSRASKYVGMTAKQLSSSRSISPSRKSIGSPTSFTLDSPPHIHSTITSPSRPRTISGPFTPRAARAHGGGGASGTPTKTRTGPGTPRARLPSSVSMPPPPSPSVSLTGRAVSLNDPSMKADSDLAASGRVIQDMISNLMSSRSPSRPPSSASIPPVFAEQQLQLQNERLQARFDAMEDENRRLRGSADAAELSVVAITTRLAAAIEAGENSTSRVAELETSLRTLEKTLGERDSTIEALQQSYNAALADVEKVRADGETRLRDIQANVNDQEQLITQLKTLIETNEGLRSENDSALSAKNAEIAVLESRVQKAYAELEAERHELGSQVDELRKAGQETIALYEERLSAADARRFELEDHVALLEEQLRVQQRPVSPATAARHAVSAAEIDNEALKEQVQHLQKKLVSLEDALEDAQVSAEREEVAARERAVRYKEREDSIRKDLADSQKEVERLTKLEEMARVRVEEIEDALRENTIALENARAEVELLRAEVSDLDGITSASGVPQTSPDQHPAPPTGDYELLTAEKHKIEQAWTDQEIELNKLRVAYATLRDTLETQTAELDAARKKLNREVTVNGGPDASIPSPITVKELTALKDDLRSHKEEIKGHKHIIQELQKELAVGGQRNKVLESENKILLTEIAQLREDMKKLEDTFEQTLMREEQNLAADEDSMASQKTVGEIKAKYEAEIDQLKRNLSDTEIKNARTVHDLNKEIGELENLIETKIYREDELESEVERLKERLSKSQKKLSKVGHSEEPRSSASSITTFDSQASAHPSLTFPTILQKFPSSDKTNSASAEDVCEICEQPGHDIFTCDLLKDEQPLGNPGSDVNGFSRGEDLLCADCEERGHTAADCPHSTDIF